MIPRLGQAVTGDAESYRYLVESIRQFPKQVGKTPAFLRCCLFNGRVLARA